jgi:hypothetical protein
VSAGPATAAERGLAWLADSAAPAGDVLQVADEAWFQEMLVRRHMAARPVQAVAWERSLRCRVDAAAVVALGVGLGPRGCRDPLAWCDETMGVLMLAHLLRVRRGGEPSAAELRERVARHFAAEPDLFTVSALHNLCYEYNLGKLGLPVPPHPALAWTAEGSTDGERLIVAAYRHTHRILFASGTLEREPDDLPALADSLRFVRRLT